MSRSTEGTPLLFIRQQSTTFGYSSQGTNLGTVVNVYGGATDSLFDPSGNLVIASLFNVYALPAGGGNLYTYATGGSGPVFFVLGPAPVPEPTMLGLLSSAAVVLLLGRPHRS